MLTCKKPKKKKTQKTKEPPQNKKSLARKPCNARIRENSLIKSRNLDDNNLVRLKKQLKSTDKQIRKKQCHVDSNRLQAVPITQSVSPN